MVGPVIETEARRILNEGIEQGMQQGMQDTLNALVSKGWITESQAREQMDATYERTRQLVTGEQ